MKETQVKELAKEVYEERRKLLDTLKREKEQGILEQVQNILMIFKESTNAGTSSKLVEEIDIQEKKDKEKLEVGVVINETFLDKEALRRKNMMKEAELIKKVRIPTEWYSDVYGYFRENLSEYFLIFSAGGEMKITIRNEKNKVVCEK